MTPRDRLFEVKVTVRLGGVDYADAVTEVERRLKTDVAAVTHPFPAQDPFQLTIQTIDAKKIQGI